MPFKLSEMPVLTDGLSGSLQTTMDTGSGFDGTLVSLAPAAGLAALVALRAARTWFAGAEADGSRTPA